MYHIFVLSKTYLYPHVCFIGNLYDRGIDVVRNKIKMFAQKKVTLPPGRHKIILLDEADRFSLLFTPKFKGHAFLVLVSFTC